MIDVNEETASHIIEGLLGPAGITPARIEFKNFPDEVNVLVYVSPADFLSLVEMSDTIENALKSAFGVTYFLVVRKSGTNEVAAAPKFEGMQDPKVAELLRLISAKSRVSSAEPSLVYVPDARASLSTVTASRHHLVFGRRGAGKSALLMEARRQIVSEAAIDSWTNIQTLRHETPQRVFLFVIADVLSSVMAGRRTVSPRSSLTLAVNEMHEQIRSMLSRDETSIEEAQRVVPRVQRALSAFLDIEGRRVVVFVDDFYYMPRDAQPTILDMLHGAFRDANIWMKIASIRHLTNWWQASPPTGLQSGQDADLIDLDVTLQDPEKASEFLEGILAEYARRVGIPTLARIFNRSALDRLVLASGAVPRDYMVLAVSAINRALRRPKARATGVQDVNQAAGDAASAKINELEEDMAANSGVAERTLATLAAVRDFCLNEQSFTYFLVGYRDKEAAPKLYSLLTDLMDVRLIHLIDSGVSDAHEAGSRSEAYMLDLSQFSGSRLKQNITVLDFEDGHFVSKLTRSKEAPQRGSTSLQLIGILRRGPVLPLARLS
ncbi:ATP-binding protein [Curtobacterium flaccumfaciens]|uniref:ATP-binding protein n=1 Tax=Curtobacterium flaccumfaciens TaxID=2035 RepID=UPI001BDE944B|nr:ATP-binding protein [Curtobacterium flaccumfaciens]MBT1606945.1 hypothetical protein [Curtobacterium flaccumfaciens pv. betae]MBT1656708.1 hypothetical protein [Curtobacterium flaccumfaciens pv. betae]MCS0472599.1 ATP-binding protein [Curtobacterium flaccumfaciens pv. betae]MCS0475507.1 ATP-binding protein [Curtobacterium flaccumfaciens pv. betae]MCS0479339.1 ATP-binding protein [Curtobacterium flaccumfaciens pv. betae]